VLFAPFVGILVDRWGSRRIAIPGLLMFCGAFAALATASGSIWQWWALWLLISFSTLGMKPTVWTTAIVSRFNKSRGFAIAVMLSGTGITGILGPVIVGLLLKEFGWRFAYVGAALIWGLVTLPLLLLFLYGAKDLKRRDQSQGAAKQETQASGLSRSEGLRSGKFIRLAISVTIMVFTVGAAVVHFVPMLTKGGMNASSAATAASLIGLGSIAGRLGTGLLLDHVNGSVIGGVAFAVPVIIMCGLLNFDGSLAMGLGLAALLGFCVGAEFDIAAYLTSRHMGMRNYGFFFGIMSGLLAFSTGMGPLAASFVYDEFGSYQPAMIVAIPLAMLGSLLVATLGPYDPRFAASGSTPESSDKAVKPQSS